MYYEGYRDSELIKRINLTNNYHYRFDIHAVLPQLKFFKRLLDVHYPHKLKVDTLLEEKFIPKNLADTMKSKKIII